MKKLLALAALAVLTLTGCGGTGKSDAPPALIQPADYEHGTPAMPQERVLWKESDLTMYEVIVTSSTGNRYRCLVTDGSSSVAQTCYDLGK